MAIIFSGFNFVVAGAVNPPPPFARPVLRTGESRPRVFVRGLQERNDLKLTLSRHVISPSETFLESLGSQGDFCSRVLTLNKSSTFFNSRTPARPTDQTMAAASDATARPTDQTMAATPDASSSGASGKGKLPLLEAPDELLKFSQTCRRFATLPAPACCIATCEDGDHSFVVFGTYLHGGSHDSDFLHDRFRPIEVDSERSGELFLFPKADIVSPAETVCSAVVVAFPGALYDVLYSPEMQTLYVACTNGRVYGLERRFLERAVFGPKNSGTRKKLALSDLMAASVLLDTSCERQNPRPLLTHMAVGEVHYGKNPEGCVFQQSLAVASQNGCVHLVKVTKSREEKVQFECTFTLQAHKPGLQWSMGLLHCSSQQQHDPRTDAEVWTCCFFGSNFLATGGEDGVLRIWALGAAITEGAAVTYYEFTTCVSLAACTRRADAGVTAVCVVPGIAPNTWMLATGSYDERLRSYFVSEEELRSASETGTPKTLCEVFRTKKTGDGCFRLAKLPNGSHKRLEKNRLSGRKKADTEERGGGATGGRGAAASSSPLQEVDHERPLRGHHHEQEPLPEQESSSSGKMSSDAAAWQLLEEQHKRESAVDVDELLLVCANMRAGYSVWSISLTDGTITRRTRSVDGDEELPTNVLAVANTAANTAEEMETLAYGVAVLDNLVFFAQFVGDIHVAQL